MDTKRTAVVIVLLLVAGSGTATTALAADSYTITLDPSVETPPRDVLMGSESFTVTSVGRVDPGESVTAETAGPDTDYDVVVYDNQTAAVATESESGDATLEFDTDGWGPGLYFVSVETDGEVQAVKPLVVSAYDVDLSAPDEATVDATIDIAVSLDSTGDPVAVGSVTAIVANADDERRTTLDATGEATYDGSISLDGMPADEYNVYAFAESADEESDTDEVVAFSDASRLTIRDQEETTSTEEDESDDELDDIDADVSDEDLHSPAETTTESEPQADAEPTETETPSEENTETATPEATPTPTQTTEQVVGNTDDEVVTQAPQTESNEPTNEPAGLLGGTTISAALAGALVLLVVAFRLR